jgi:hypothetical protein
MAGKIGEKQEQLLYELYDDKTGERRVLPTWRLGDVFYDEEHSEAVKWGEDRLYNKSLLFQARRALNALIRRGLVQDAGTLFHEVHPLLGGHPRTNRTFTLTDTGMAMAKTIAPRWAAEYAARDAAERERRRMSKEEFDRQYAALMAGEAPSR